MNGTFSIFQGDQMPLVRTEEDYGSRLLKGGDWGPGGPQGTESWCTLCEAHLCLLALAIHNLTLCMIHTNDSYDS